MREILRREQWATGADTRDLFPVVAGGTVDANRRRVNGAYGKHLLRKRGELIVWSFAHCYDTGGMGRTHLRGHQDILKRLLIHVGAFNTELDLPYAVGIWYPTRTEKSTVLLSFSASLASGSFFGACALHTLFPLVVTTQTTSESSLSQI